MSRALKKSVHLTDQASASPSQRRLHSFRNSAGLMRSDQDDARNVRALFGGHGAILHPTYSICSDTS